MNPNQTEKIFLISDTHFCHKNIIEYADRPFLSVEEMNEKIIENWNKAVKKNYKVIIAGDFALCGKEKMKELVERLNGYKILILGNHDRSYNSMKSFPFDEVIKYPILIQEKYIISHHPLENVPTGFVNIHGHIHNREMHSLNYFNISVEQIGYTPIELKEIEKRIDLRILTGRREI
jgi:calcineurin-like phosphoesterase family protein